MRGWAVAIAMVAVGGCVPGGTQATALPPVSACGAERVQDAIGHRRSDRLAAAVRRRSGAASIRFLAPGEIHTMEFWSDRLTITLEENGRIARVSCG